MSLQNEAFASSKFVPESPSHWVRDENRSNCKSCDSQFSLLKRKHHCRSCSEVFCDTCTQYRLKARSKREPHLIVRVRVCEKCFETFRGRKKTGKTIRMSSFRRPNTQSINQSVVQSKTQSKISTTASTSQSINQSEQLATPLNDSKVSSVKTTSLDGPSIDTVINQSISPLDTSINQSINGPIPVGKFSVVSHTDLEEEDDFYSDDEGDHPMETDDEWDPSMNQSISRSVNLDGDKLPSISVSTVSKHDFFAIEEENDRSVEPKIVSEEHDDKPINQSINIDGGKIDNLVFNQLPMTLTGRNNLTVNQSMHSVSQSPLLDLLNFKSPKSDEIRALSDKELITQSIGQSVEKEDINLDGVHVAPIVTIVDHTVKQSSNQVGKQVFSINLDNSNMDQAKIVVGPDTINQSINQSINKSVSQPVKSSTVDKKLTSSTTKSTNQSIKEPIKSTTVDKKSTTIDKKSPTIDTKTTTKSINRSLNQSANELTELDRPFDDPRSSHQSIVAGPGAFNQSINGPDVIADSIAHNAPTTPSSVSESINRSDRALFNQDAAEERLISQQIDQSITYDDDSIPEESVMSTKSADLIGLAALPKQKSINQSTSQSVNQSKKSSDQSVAPLSSEIAQAREWASSVDGTDHSNSLNSGLPVAPACWPNAELVNQIEHQSTSQSIKQSKPVINQSHADETKSAADDMWSPIGPTSSSPLGLAAMKVEGSNKTTSKSINQSINASSSGEFDPVTRKRTVKVRVLRGARTSWRSRLLHPVPATFIVCFGLLLAALLLPFTFIGLTGATVVAGLVAYFWPRLEQIISLALSQLSGNQSTNHSAVSTSKNISINQSTDKSVARVERRDTSVEMTREHRVKPVVV